MPGPPAPRRPHRRKAQIALREASSEHGRSVLRDRRRGPERRARRKAGLALETGLLGVLPGITGTIMANEVIKIITGYGSVLSGKIMVFDIKDYDFRLLEIPVNPENRKRKLLDEKY